MLIFTTSLTVEDLRKEAERRRIWQKIDGVIPMKPVNLNRFSKALDRQWEKKRQKNPEVNTAIAPKRERKPQYNKGVLKSIIKCTRCRVPFIREEGYVKNQYQVCPQCMKKMRVR